ncbi:MAG: DNA adenine methylase [Bacteroidota bacterium]
MIKSPLRYPGGKSKALKQIAPLIPDYLEYREPFVGGGSVYLQQKQFFPDRKFWINDLYVELFYFWQESRDQLEAVVQQVERWKVYFQDGKALHRFLIAGLAAFSPLEKASAFFVLNRITFSGTSESGGFSNQAFQKRFTDSSIDRLRKLDGLLQNTKITNLDYQKVIEQNGEQVFIFLDPPYHAATKSALYGKKGHLHKGFDHERFAESLQNCTHQWLITYDDSEYIRSLFSFAKIIGWQHTYGMKNVGKESKQKAKEIFISNYL